MAAANNADLYEAVFSSWSLPYARLPFAFVGRANPPPYYSNMTALRPNHHDKVIAELHLLSRSLPGALGLKDSFSEFDLARYGFQTLFEASWLWRAPSSTSVCLPPGWSRVAAPAELDLWEQAWKQAGSPTEARVFRSPQSLQNAAFFHRVTEGRVTGGCIANRSSECVGVSNIFGDGAAEILFEEATSTVAQFGGGRPVVGYVANHWLNAALRSGFEVTGNLRVLVAESPHF
jgi:hypothetical protein